MHQGTDSTQRLKQLLALKRYEAPPPGYFDELPRAILGRIEAEATPRSWWQAWLPEISWKPFAAYASLAACGIMGMASVAIWAPENEGEFPQWLANSSSTMALTAGAEGQMMSHRVHSLQEPGMVSKVLSSTKPIIRSPAYFQAPRSGLLHTASFGD